ncbi:MAG: 3'-5' exonuclease [Acidimicrobiales bacterium]|jgi:DNA polymerase elongation subunit (family B)
MACDVAVYGLDIETDTATDGLDPRVGRVLAAAVAGPDGEVVLAHDDEGALLRTLDRWLADLTPGVLVTWNGAAFDLPYLASRAAINGAELGLRLELDASIGLRGDPLPGHEGAYRARWYGHGHLDAFRVFRADVGRTFGLPCGLKAVAGLVGLDHVDTDPTRVHELEQHALHTYVASDARCTRQLALLRWPTAAAAVDRVPIDRVSVDALPVAVAPAGTGGDLP